MQKYFGKRRINTIHLVEFVSYRRTIRVSSQIQVKKAIFKENTKRFRLGYNSLLFNSKILDQIEQFRELEEARELVLNKKLLL